MESEDLQERVLNEIKLLFNLNGEGGKSNSVTILNVILRELTRA